MSSVPLSRMLKVHFAPSMLPLLLATGVAGCAAPTKPDSANHAIKMACRGTLMSFEWGWLETAIEAVITIHAGGRQVTYAGRRFGGTYAVRRNDDDSIVFRGGAGVEGSLNRHTGGLVMSTSDAKRVANLTCEPLRSPF